jgi:hypothetical protein
MRWWVLIFIAFLLAGNPPLRADEQACRKAEASAFQTVNAAFGPKIDLLLKLGKVLQDKGTDPRKYPIVKSNGTFENIDLVKAVSNLAFENANAVKQIHDAAVDCTKTLSGPERISALAAFFSTERLASVWPSQLAHIDISEMMSGQPLGGQTALVPKARDEIVRELNIGGETANIIRDPLRCFFDNCDGVSPRRETLPGAPASPPLPDVPTASDIQKFFPWPPPTPSTRRSFALARLGTGSAHGTWGEAADSIENVLNRAKYESWGYYLAADGFAVATRVEQLDNSTGVPLAGAGRWPSDPRLASSSGFLGGLLTFSRPVGAYRTFVFVVTTDPVISQPTTDEAKFFEIARHWAPQGAPSLPDNLRRLSLGAGYQLIVFVYEFEHAAGGKTQLNVPGRWSFDAHLANAGIVLAQ